MCALWNQALCINTFYMHNKLQYICSNTCLKVQGSHLNMYVIDPITITCLHKLPNVWHSTYVIYYFANFLWSATLIPNVELTYIFFLFSSQCIVDVSKLLQKIAVSKNFVLYWKPYKGWFSFFKKNPNQDLEHISK